MKISCIYVDINARCDIGCMPCGANDELSLTNHSDFFKRGYFIIL